MNTVLRTRLLTPLLLIAPLLLLTGCFEDPEEVKKEKAQVRHVMAEHIGGLMTLSPFAADDMIDASAPAIKQEITAQKKAISDLSDAGDVAMRYLHQQFYRNMGHVIEHVDIEDNTAIVKVSSTVYDMAALKATIESPLKDAKKELERENIDYDAYKQRVYDIVDDSFKTVEPVTFDEAVYQLEKSANGSWKVYPGKIHAMYFTPPPEEKDKRPTYRR